MNESPDELTAPVRYEVSVPVAVLTLDRPPVNRLDLQARGGLLAALARASADPMVEGYRPNAAGYHGECWQPAPLLCQYAAAHRRLTDI